MLCKDGGHAVAEAASPLGRWTRKHGPVEPRSDAGSLTLGFEVMLPHCATRLTRKL